MKLLKWTTIVFALALALTAPETQAAILTLTPADGYVGVITPDGGSPPTEIMEIQTLIGYAANSQTTVVYSKPVGVQTYTRSALDTTGFADPTTLTFNKATSNLGQSFTVTGYILGKYDNDKAGAYVWYFATPTTVSLPSNLGTCGNGGGCGISHIIYNGVAVPDGGTTLMLLGGALVGLETLRRRFRA